MATVYAEIGKTEYSGKKKQWNEADYSNSRGLQTMSAH